MKKIVLLIAFITIAGCGDACDDQRYAHGEIAENISGPLGVIVPYATDEQRETFERGLDVAGHRFSRAEGLGPAFNVTFCGSCHEKPNVGGSGGLYRNFFIAGVQTDTGRFLPARSAGAAGGVVRMLAYNPNVTDMGEPPGEEDFIPARPSVPGVVNVAAQRNPIPFYGSGLLAELSADDILRNADPDDEDGDGISGRPNIISGFVGRFGRKAQTADVEGFIRGPLMNHAGITSNPLTEEQRSRLPIDSSGGGRGDGEGGGLTPPEDDTLSSLLNGTLLRHAQAAAPSAPLRDNDGVADPELAPEELFDLVSFTMLTAAPDVAPITSANRAGQEVFDELSCQKCHIPRLHGPRGALPVYSDLLLHDMGASLDDGIPMGEATTSEFRTQPLWGLAATGPYLHDGRAHTIEEAIAAHDGEALASADGYRALSEEDRDALLHFLDSLGGKELQSKGMLHPDAPLEEIGAYGGPIDASVDTDRFREGRDLYDEEFGLSDGVGADRFNGDSCRACHFEPVLGGAGPRGVNVIRHGILAEDGTFSETAEGSILHKVTRLDDASVNRPDVDANVFELRQTPHTLGLGLVEGIAEDVIIAGEDPDDTITPDGISGRAAILSDGRLGRFGWKAQIPSIAEFVRDAVSAELGMTMPPQPGLTFGITSDSVGVADPEMSTRQTSSLGYFLFNLAPPPRQVPDDAAAAERGEQAFNDIGCTGCHTPSLPGAAGDVPLYSDLLLHDILADDVLGVPEGVATSREFRTAPLWGISTTAPYLHDGSADNLDEAIRDHHAESAASRDAYIELSEAEKSDLMTFLMTL